MTYFDEAPRWWKAGWRGVLPLPAGQKWPPPTGYTGIGAPYPDRDQVLSWLEEHGAGNLAIRLPEGVVAFDVDAYTDALAFLALADTLGPLPPTWRSTARGADLPWGIYLYRVPVGLRFRNFPHVEVIQPGHRYIARGVHPGDAGLDDDHRKELHFLAGPADYLLIGPNGEVVADDEWPTLDDIPELPFPWIEHASAGAEGRTVPLGKPDVIHEATKRVAQLLADHYGAQPHHADGGVILMTRPGKNPRLGYSCTVGFVGPGVVRMFSPSWPPFEMDAKYDEADLRHHVAHGSFPTEAEKLGGLIAEPAPAAAPVTVADLRRFATQDLPAYDWLCDGLLERQDRVILTAAEGAGKTTLLRQIGVRLAAGLHPFTEDTIPPVRVLHADCENGLRFSVREFARLYRKVADGLVDDTHFPVILPGGLDLQDVEDRRKLHGYVEATTPALLIIGPIYKLFGGDPTEELPTKQALMFLDAMRAQYGLAIILEAHTPNETPGKVRVIRPYGASIQRRWPEFGLYLDPRGLVIHWRGARDERDWPVKIRRGDPLKGDPWPWMAETLGTTDTRFILLYDACVTAGRILSERELADATGIPRTTVQRTIRGHAEAWLILRQTLSGNGDS